MTSSDLMEGVQGLLVTDEQWLGMDGQKRLIVYIGNLIDFSLWERVSEQTKVSVQAQASIHMTFHILKTVKPPILHKHYTLVCKEKNSLVFLLRGGTETSLFISGSPASPKHAFMFSMSTCDDNLH